MRANTELSTETALVAASDLTPRDEQFAQLVATGSALNVAYREVFDVGEDTKRATVNNRAHALARRGSVKARIIELQTAIAERVIISAAELRVRQYDIATAESLVHTKRYNCRWCPSDGKHYVWADSDEFCDACDEWKASPGTKRKPSPLGGFTFDPFDPPNPSCRRCRGVGEAFIYGPQDTTQLEGAQRAAYAGASIDARTGTIEVHQHDAQVAAKELHAMVPGAYAPARSVSVNANVNVPIPDSVAPADALAFLKSLVPS